MATETRDVLVKVDIDRKGADTGLGSIKDKGEKATKSLKDTKKAAGDTSKSLQSLAADTKIFGVSVNSLSAGFTSMRAVIGKTIATLKIFKTALISTGIGALVVAAGALIVFLTRMQAGVDIVNKAMAQLGAVVDVILDRLAKLGKVIIGFGGAVVKALKGDFKGAMESAKEAAEELKEVFVDIGEEIAKDVKLAGGFADSMVELEIATIKTIEPFANIRKQIAQNLLDSKDQEKSAKRRLQAVLNAATLEEGLLTKQIELQTELVRIEVGKVGIAESLRNETREVEEAKAKLLQLEEASLKKRASIAAQIEKFTKAVAKEEQETEVIRQEATELRQASADQEELQKEVAHIRTLERLGIETTAFEVASIKKIEINKVENDEIIEQSQEKQDALTDQARVAAEKAKAIAKAKEDALLAFAAQGLASQKAFTKIDARFKQGLAIREIFIFTQAAIARANKDVPFPLSFVVGAIYAALGVASAAAVAGVQFAKGGKIKSSRAPRTGDRVLIRANPGEVVLNDTQQAKLGGDATFRKIGVPGFQGGGIVPAAAISPASGELSSFTDAISGMKFVITVEDINEGQDRVAIVENKAIISV